MRFAARFPSIDRVQNAPQMDVNLAEALGAEHICLESDEFVVPRRPRGLAIGPTLAVRSRLHGCETELAVLEGHQLGIRLRRPRGLDRRYVVDLRFVDAEPVVRRRVAWRVWQLFVALAILASIAGWLAASRSAPLWLGNAWLATLVLASLAAVNGLLALYRTHETVAFVSVHGRANLAEVTGRIGCRRACAAFATDLGRRVAEARQAIAQSRQQFLRDELREHRRLHEDGVLAADAYEAGKRRILRAHG